jgi:two-component system nitrate/nitrite response regulator NarL
MAVVARTGRALSSIHPTSIDVWSVRMQEALQSGLSTPDEEPVPQPTVLIVDDHRLFAEAMTWALERLGMRVVVASSVQEALEANRQHRPSLVLMDIGLPGASGLSVGKEILRQTPEAKVIAVTALQDQSAVKEAIRLGFHGYITKDTPMERFAASINAAVGGQMVMPHHLARIIGEAPSDEERHASVLVAQLTARERQVLEMLVEGASSAVIAQRLSISPNTVRSHIQSILPKLQVHSRLEAAAFAVRYGLAEPRRSAR